MSEERVEVTIDKNGNVSMKVIGVKGPKCQEITAPIIEALGGELLEHETTPEYYEQMSEEEQQQINQQ
jgi:hypothetical protein